MLAHRLRPASRPLVQEHLQQASKVVVSVTRQRLQWFRSRGPDS